MIEILFLGFVAISFPDRAATSSARALLVDGHTPSLRVLSAMVASRPSFCTDDGVVTVCDLAGAELSLSGASGAFKPGSKLPVKNYLMDIQAAYKKSTGTPRPAVGSGWSASLEITAGTLDGRTEIAAANGMQEWEYVSKKHGTLKKSAAVQNQKDSAVAAVTLDVKAKGITIKKGASTEELKFVGPALVFLLNDGPGGNSSTIEHYHLYSKNLLGIGDDDEHFLPRETKPHKALDVSKLVSPAKWKGSDVVIKTIQHMERCPPALLYMSE